jgi:Uma2 family endonuclease
MKRMSVTQKRPATYADLQALPENLVGEIFDGELIASPRPSLGHSRVSSVLGADIGGPFDRGRGGPGGWWILDEPELHLGSDVVVPDLAGWRRSRCPQVPAGLFTSLAPDWVCEVQSPSTASIDRIRKMPIYLREGVDCVWLIDPLSRTFEVFRREDNRWVLIGNSGGDAKIRAEPFEAVELELAALWPEALP